MTEHRATSKPLSALKAADYNPRTISPTELARLVRSLDQFGFVEPVVVRAEDLLVVGGHQRLLAMRKLLAERGLDQAEIEAHEVPVVLVSDLSDDQTKALNLALNKIGGEWDYDKLAELFAELPADAAALSGFTATEIDDITALMSEAVERQAAALGEPDDAQKDADAELARLARKFSFEVETDEEAALVREVLQVHGMTGSRNAARALVAALRALQA